MFLAFYFIPGIVLFILSPLFDPPSGRNGFIRSMWLICWPVAGIAYLITEG